MRDPLLRNQVYKESRLSSAVPSRSTISTSESGQELWPVGVKLGIVRLGHAAGKLKYTLVDEQDIVLAREYTFEARMQVDASIGATVFAYAYLTSKNRSSACLLQDLIWRRHHGPVPEHSRVVHRNHIAMDNRLDNLCLIDIANALVWYTSMNAILTPIPLAANSPRSLPQPLIVSRPVGQPEHVPRDAQPESSKTISNDLQLTLYWAAIQQLPPDPNNDASHAHHNCMSGEHRSSSDQSDKELHSYFECHYPPCVRIEREPREFSICGRCHAVSYCSQHCQLLNWPVHRRSCRMKSRAERRSSMPYYRPHEAE